MTTQGIDCRPEKYGESDLENQIDEEEVLIQRKDMAVPPTGFIMPSKREDTQHSCLRSTPTQLLTTSKPDIQLMTTSKPDIQLMTTSKPDIQLPEANYPEPNSGHHPGTCFQRLSSIKKNCGAHPGLILALCGILISVWITWIFIFHLNNKINQLATMVLETNEHMKTVQNASLDFRVRFDRTVETERRFNEVLNKKSVDRDTPDTNKIETKHEADSTEDWLKEESVQSSLHREW